MTHSLQYYYCWAYATTTLIDWIIPSIILTTDETNSARVDLESYIQEGQPQSQRCIVGITIIVSLGPALRRTWSYILFINVSRELLLLLLSIQEMINLNRILFSETRHDLKRGKINKI